MPRTINYHSLMVQPRKGFGYSSLLSVYSIQIILMLIYPIKMLVKDHPVRGFPTVITGQP